VYDPSSLSGLRGWWKANAITTPPADGGALQTWTDSSVNAQPFIQATVGKRPIYRTTGAFLPNSMPCVEYTPASAQELICSTLTNATPMTRFLMVRPKSFAAGMTMFGIINGFQFAFTTAGRVESAVGNVTFLNQGGSATCFINTWYALTFADNNSNTSTNYINGTQDMTTTTTAHTATATSTPLGSSNGSSYFNGYIAEFIDYNRVLTTLERAQVHSYLSDQYGVTVSDYTASYNPPTGMPPDVPISVDSVAQPLAALGIGWDTDS
jgi:hypothetical protein